MALGRLMPGRMRMKSFLPAKAVMERRTGVYSVRNVGDSLFW
jgi:hypothetical protein